ncbi:MAG: Fic family protein [Pseudolabrys sp.]
MIWNWQRPDWPDFTYDSKALQSAERDFLQRSGEFIGAFRHVGQNDQDAFKIELISDEAVKTSQIEGEILDRASVQSSLRRQFGLAQDGRRVAPAERGIAEMMVDLYRTFDAPLTHEAMFAWHKMLLGFDKRIGVVGGYRTRRDAMQIVSFTARSEPKIHFEAPPSSRLRKEMNGFVRWFNETAPTGKRALPPLTRAGIAHLYFESIHPFEDGNGRIGRALAEKSLAQNLGQPSLIALAYTIERARPAYYAALERNNKANKITDWLVYFSKTVVEAQDNTMRRVDFYVAKTKFYERHRGALNERQHKVIARMFREGIDGFAGGLSADNYISIAKTSRATATRDLADLVKKGALERTGELRHTRYRLALQR